jgi:Domain of unknown function (DUF4365)
MRCTKPLICIGRHVRSGYRITAVRRHPLGCQWCLDQNNHQGWYGESFVQVLAAAAGLQCSPLTPDCTGVDYDISGTQELRGDFPCMKVQVKSWSAPKGSDDAWHYGGLTEKRFNALAGPRRLPRFLFVVIVPRDTDTFAEADDDLLRLSRAAYWVSLENSPRIENPSCQRRVRLLIPKQNLLTAKSLRVLCEEADLAGGASVA